MRTTYDFAPLWRSTIGFDRLFDLVDAAQQAGTEDNYPPCNVERLGEDRYQISLAVAGFSPDEIAITAEQSVVTVEGRKAEKQQREFLLYSVEDADRMTSEVDKLVAAWRLGDATQMAKLLQEGFDEYPDLYRPLTVDRNRKWIPQIEQLLDGRDDYLVVVGALHLVGTDSVIDLLSRKGYKIKQL